MKRPRRKGRYSLPDDVQRALKELQEFEDFYRKKIHFTTKIDVVLRIFFEKDEYEWIKSGSENEWFVSSKYHRYYNLSSQKGIKSFCRLNDEEKNFYYERCRQTIKDLYESKNSYAFLRFYEKIENKFVLKEKEKAKEYYNRYIKPEFQKEIEELKIYEQKLSEDLKKYYKIHCFPSIVDAFLFEINQSKEEIRYNLYTKTGINRFRKLPKEEKFKYISKIKEKITNFYNKNKNYYSNCKGRFEEKPAFSFNIRKNDNKKMSAAQCYKILGLEYNATKEQINKSYITLSKLYHPDNSNTGDVEKFQILNKAYNFIMKDV